MALVVFTQCVFVLDLHDREKIVLLPIRPKNISQLTISRNL